MRGKGITYDTGFFPGDDIYARIEAFTSGNPQLWAALGDVPVQVNAFLRRNGCHGPASVRWQGHVCLRVMGGRRYMRDLLTIFEQEGMDSAFWFTFAGYALPHRADPRYDLDMASYGVVKNLEKGQGSTYPDMGWEPKESFYALAAAGAG